MPGAAATTGETGWTAVGGAAHFYLLLVDGGFCCLLLWWLLVLDLIESDWIGLDESCF